MVKQNLGLPTCDLYLLQQSRSKAESYRTATRKIQTSKDTTVNVVHNRIDAERELRKATKVLQNFELLSKSINTEIARLHSIGLTSARKEVERAKHRFARAKELVRLRI